VPSAAPGAIEKRGCDGEDGRIKLPSASVPWLEDGIGDTIRVGLTEDPEFEIPACPRFAKRHQSIDTACG
jgi:(E)-4-hydroxy-3-methylbut-2-enyl-diphosphate synthase